MPENVNVNTHPENARSETSKGVRRRVLTFDDLQNYALAKLGFPNVDVEIDPIQMGIFWEAVLDEYNKWLPIEKTAVFTGATASINKYDLQAQNKPFGRGITFVQVIARDRYFVPISGFMSLGIPHPISWLSPDQYDLVLRYIGTTKKIYSSEPDWEWEEPILWVYAPSGFSNYFAVAYKYSTDVSEPADIPQEDWSWVKKYFLCQVKEAVGEARGKLGGIPGPAGLSLRGPEMIQEALDKMEKLEEEIENKSYCRVPPLGPGSR